MSATTASFASTFIGFPVRLRRESEAKLQLDSLKSRLQSSRESVSIPRLAAEVIREEGIGGCVFAIHLACLLTATVIRLWRGFP